MDLRPGVVREPAGPSGSERITPDADREVAALVLAATRGLLRAERARDVLDCAHELVVALGGSLVLAAEQPVDGIPVDLAFGEAEPLLPVAPPGSAAREALERHLPGFVRDAYRALELIDRPARLADEALRDPLTGLGNRRAAGRWRARLRPGSALVVLDLDHFKQVNDTYGHDEGDRVLRTFGEVLGGTIRDGDHAARLGGEEFLVVVDAGGVEPFLSRLADRWAAVRPRPVTYSAGVAVVGEGCRDPMSAADRALYRAKRSGRDRWLWADREDCS